MSATVTFQSPSSHVLSPTWRLVAQLGIVPRSKLLFLSLGVVDSAGLFLFVLTAICSGGVKQKLLWDGVIFVVFRC